MKKIEKINAVIGECGLTAEEAGANLYESGAVSQEFLHNLWQDKSWQWSSVAPDYSPAWVVNPSDGYMYHGYKDSTTQVRCVLAFKL